MVTIKDIAKEADVASSTVSYALNNDLRIPEDTRARILEVAQKLGYKGISGKKGSAPYKKHIVLCLNSINGTIFSEITSSLKEILKHSDCEILIYLGKDITNIKWMDGLIILNSRVTNEDIEEIVKRKIPVIIMDRTENIPGTVSVTLDNFKGCYDVTQHVIRMGAKKFVFVGGPTSSFESNMREDGFKKAVADNFNDDVFIKLNGDFSFDSGNSIAKYLMSSASLPDAIICANDEMAMGIINAIDKETVFSGKSLIVAGFDGNVKAPPHGYITAIADRAKWGHSVAYTLLNCFNKSQSVQNIVLPVNLTIF